MLELYIQEPLCFMKAMRELREGNVEKTASITAYGHCDNPPDGGLDALVSTAASRPHDDPDVDKRFSCLSWAACCPSKAAAVVTEQA
jgi:hypothetical protein